MTGQEEGALSGRSDFQAIAAWVRPDSTVLDLGCGDGLLLKYLKLRARYGWSLSNLVALLRQQLFVYRDLQAWLDKPFQAPPALAGLHDGQLALEY